MNRREYEEKLNELQMQLNYIQREIDSLKAEPIREEYQKEPVKAAHLKAETLFSNADKKEKSGNYEEKIGKNVMGILASVLVLISITLFVSLVYRYLSDGVKIAGMFIFSFGMAAAGYVKRQGRMGQTILGCGCACIYLSLFITSVYFGAFNDYVLYGAIVVWAVAILILAEKSLDVFRYIGMAGVLVSVIFGTYSMVDVSEETNTAKAIFLIVYFIVMSGIYIISGRNKSRKEYTVELTSVLLGTVCSIIICDEVIAVQDVWIQLVMVLAVCAYTIFINGAFIRKVASNGGYIAYQMISLAYIMLLKDALIMTQYRELFAIVAVAALWLTGELRQKRDGVRKAVLSVLWVTEMILLCGMSWNMAAIAEEAVSFEGYGVAALILLTCGFAGKDNLYKHMGILSAMLSVIFNGFLIEAVLFAVGMTVCECVFGEDIRKSMGMWLAVYAMYVIMSIPSLLVDETAVVEYMIPYAYMVTVLFHVGVTGYGLDKEYRHYEKYLSVVTLLLMAAGLVLIQKQENIVTHIVVVLAALVPFTMNTARIMSKSDGMFPGIYTGIKFCTYILTVINSFNANDYVVDIVMIAAALCFIILGFKMEYKSLRVYGLVVTMISICKLVLLDIQYDNSVGRAVSFLVCGVLCFAINAVYQKMKA